MKRILKIVLICALLFSGRPSSGSTKDNYSSASVLSQGVWFKIAVNSDGIYRIDFNRLKQAGLQDPSIPRIFGNNAGQLSFYNDSTGIDDLREIPIYIYSGSDGVFNEGDYLLFYAQGTSRWILNKNRFNYLKHEYSDTAFYFITSGNGNGKRIGVFAEPSVPANYTSASSDVLFVHEVDNENIKKSGREWYQQISTLHIDPGFKDLITSENLKYEVRVAARAARPSFFKLSEGSTLRKTIEVQGVNLFDYNGTYFQITDSSGTIPVSSSSPVFDLQYVPNGDAGVAGWLDRIIFQGRTANQFSGPVTKYIDSKSVQPGRISAFTISTLNNDAIIWDVTDPFNIKNIVYNRSSGNISFKSASDSLKTFIGFTVVNAAAITNMVPVPVQDLHSSASADMIIISHPLFAGYAEKLADIHLNHDGLTSQIVTPQQIYNEFSGGIPDICAIRNFVRMKYSKQKGSAHQLKYLLLFGDGSYENRTPPPGNTNFVPTYQSQNSNVVVSSFTSDDFYGLLDDGEGEAEGTEDIGIGRLPVSDTLQAGIVLAKIRKYLNPANMGSWKNVICLSADDEDGNIHIANAEGLAGVINDSVPVYNIDKIYLDAYKQTTTVNGQSYPDATKAINDRINSGCLIFNYTGHGNEYGLAAETVVSTDDIKSWNNGGKLPLFITATCEFSRFDDIERNIATNQMTDKPSAGEMVLLNKNGGAIALMSTTRVVYSAPNYDLNKNIFSCAFSKDRNGNSMTFGDIIKTAKNNSGSEPNKRNFTLLGDPALKLAYPYYGEVKMDSINGVSVYNQTDSLKALSVITISGHITEADGNPAQSFSGTVSTIIYDKPVRINTLANDGGQSMSFNLLNNILFNGKTTATNGTFRFSFIVPRDIDYTFGQGKISFYANDEAQDMNGRYNDIIVGGFSNSFVSDAKGPEIKLYLNDTLFRNGGITDGNPRLLAIIEDQNGINATGTGIGHDLTGYLDNEFNNLIILNSYYESDFDNYTRGSVNYNLTGLSEGDHTITVKAWDNFNNSSEATISFKVENGGKFILTNLRNYPNPFFSETNITLEHNRPGEDLNVTINIFNIDGRIVRVIKTTVNATGYALPPVVWDGKDQGGHKIARGMYPYSVTIVTSKGETASTTGRLINL
jgi:hypothetical protein